MIDVGHWRFPIEILAWWCAIQAGRAAARRGHPSAISSPGKPNCKMKSILHQKGWSRSCSKLPFPIPPTGPKGGIGYGDFEHGFDRIYTRQTGQCVGESNARIGLGYS